MNLPTQNKGKPELKLSGNNNKGPVFFNAQGFGKAGNNAITIMVAQGYFTDAKNIELELEVYKDLTKKIYLADVEAQKDIKGELN